LYDGKQIWAPGKKAAINAARFQFLRLCLTPFRPRQRHVLLDVCAASVHSLNRCTESVDNFVKNLGACRPKPAPELYFNKTMTKQAVQNASKSIAWRTALLGCALSGY